MKSNKQRRAEIKQQRLARAARLERQLKAAPSGRHACMAGLEPADGAILARHNPYPGCGGLPAHYLDRPFRCCDCGSEEVWTAKQQKWWYETVGVTLNSGVKRCLVCRRARRAELAKARSAPGANHLRDEVAWLRAVPASMPDAATEQRVEAALASKWDGVRKVAIEVLSRWQRAQDAPRLREWAGDATRPWYSGPRRAAAEALAPLLRHPQDDEWVMQAYAGDKYAPGPWGGFVHGIDARSFDAFVQRELDAGDPRRLENIGLMLCHARRRPVEPLWQRLLAHPEGHVAAMARYALRTIGMAPPPSVVTDAARR